MDLEKIQLSFPKNWKEVSRMGKDKQVVIRVYHINPISKIDPKERQDYALESKNPNESRTRVSAQISGPNPLTDFYSSMKASIESGLMPPEMTMEKLDTLWKGMTATPHAERPPESDIAGDIGIVEFEDGETAYQTLKKQTMGFVQEGSDELMGGISIPGITKDSTIKDYEENDFLKKMMTKEQFLGILKMYEVQKKEVPKLKEELKKSALKYEEKTYLGCKAIFSEMPNPNPRPKIVKNTSKKKDQGMGGSRGNDITAAMPKIEKSDTYIPIFKCCLGLVCGKYLINGSLLSLIENLPSGDTQCHSLSNTKEVVSKMKEGDTVFTDITLVPTASTYSQEGYPTKEDVEEIFTNVISTLK